MPRIPVYPDKYTTVTATSEDQKQIIGAQGTINYSSPDGSGSLTTGQSVTVSRNTQLIASGSKSYATVLDVAGTIDSISEASLPSTVVTGGLGAALGPGYDIIIGAGQSNMCGRGTSTNSRLDWVDSRIFQYGRTTFDGVTTYADQISQAIDPLSYPENSTSTAGPSPLLTFARRYANTLAANRKVLVIPAAFGGTGLCVPGGSSSKQWSVGYTPTNNSLYAAMIAQVQAAISAAGSGTHRVVAALWVQGEQDGDNSVSGATYQAALDTLIDSLRTDLGVADLPFIIGQLVPRFLDYVGSPTRRAINNVHLDTPRRKTSTAFAYGPTGTANDLNDYNHYSSAGLRAVGRAMWTAYDRAGANVTGVAPVALTDAPTVSQSGTTATVTWAQSSGRVTDYTLQYRAQGAGSWTTASRSLPLEVTFGVTGLTLGTTYEFRVAVVNEQGTSAYSPTATFAMASVPAQVTGLSAGSVTAYLQNLSWTAVAGATGYLIEYKETSSGTWLTGSTVTANSGQVTGLVPSTSYDYRVSATNAAGTGTPSATATKSTVAPISMATDVGITPYAAYGLRNLVDSYAGYAVKVRRSSDNTTQDIGFNGSGDLDQTALTTFLSGSDGFVDTLYDQSGNGYDLTQATTASQPKIATAGTIETQGSKPCMTFDGSNDYLSRTAAGLFAASTATVMRVEKVNSTGLYVSFGEGSSAGQNPRYIPGYQSSGALVWPVTTDAGIALINSTISGITADNSHHQLTFTDTGSVISVHQNGSAKLSSAGYTRSGTSANLNRTSLGGWLQPTVSAAFAGKISEVVTWTTALDSTQRARGEANQKAYYGTP